MSDAWLEQLRDQHEGAAGGVGVVPVALLASLFNSGWMALSMMLVGVALTYGTRMLAFWMFGYA